MSIEEIKDAYQQFSKEVFSGSRSGASSRLEKMVKRMVCKYTGDAEARILSGAPAKSSVACKTYVSITSLSNTLLTLSSALSAQNPLYMQQGESRSFVRTSIQKSRAQIHPYGRLPVPHPLLLHSSTRSSLTASATLTAAWVSITRSRS